MTDYPDDADGAVLANLAAEGIDMSLPMLIEFAVAFTWYPLSNMSKKGPGAK